MNVQAFVNHDAPRILLMDDDAALLELAEDVLHGDFPGYRIETTDNLDGLAAALEQGPLNLVITDYHMKGLTGLDVFHFVKRRYPDCPVMMFTSTGDEEIAVQAMKAGLDDYVIKSSTHIRRLPMAVHALLKQAAERQRLKEAVARSLALTENVLDTSAIGIIVLNAQFRVECANKSLERFFGMSQEELVGRDNRQLIDARIKHFFEDPEVFAGAILKTYAQNDYALSFDCHVLAGEGREARWLEHRSEPIRNGLWAGGRIEHYYDITERKNLEVQQHRLASFPQINPFPIIEIDAAGSVTFSNPSADRVFPDLALAGPAHPITRHALDAMKTLDKTGLPSLVCEAELAGRIYELDCWPVRGENLLRFYVFDIAERKQAEQSLLASELRYRRLFEAAKDGILILNPETNLIVDVNPYLQQLLGYTRDEFLGKTLWNIGFLPDQASSRLSFDELKKSGYVKYDDLPIQGKDGRQYEVEFVSNLYEVGGAPVIQCNIRNVTERKEMERHAGRLQHLATLGQLLGGIAHELKNPLFVLAGRLELAKEKLAAQEYATLPADLDKIEEAAKRMIHVTERFLTIARPGAPQRTGCAMAAILRESLEFLSNELMKHHIQVATDLPSDLPDILADPRLLQEVYLNLMLNAMQAMVSANGKGTLTVTASLTADTETRGRGDTAIAPSGEEGHGEGVTERQGGGERWIEVRIQDDGPGIPPEHCAKLFDPFFSTKPLGEGTGLGLWTVRSILSGMKGQVSCETEVSKGTTFVVKLPVSEELTIQKN